MLPFRRIYLILTFLTTLQGFSQVDPTYFIKDFVIEGNKRTKEWLIIKESGYAIGDSIAPENLDNAMQSIRTNVENQQLYTSVEVSAITLPDRQILVLISVYERWYIYPIPIIELDEPNFNVWWRNRRDSRTNYGLRVNDYNFRGRNERFELIFKFGYTRQFAFKYSSPYISKEKNWGIYLTGSFNENDEITAGTVDNKRLFYQGKDSRARVEYMMNTGLTKRPNLYDRHGLHFSYRAVDVEDSLLTTFYDYLIGQDPQMSYFGMAYSFDRTKVDRRGYPLIGNAYSARLEKKGLGIINGAPDILEAYLTYRHYQFLSSRWHSQHVISAKSTQFVSLPYYIQRGLGYGSSSIRSFEYYIMDGQHYALNRNNLKYTLIPERGIPMTENMHTLLKQLQIGVYLNLIADIGYVRDQIYADSNSLNNELLLGTGVGVDMVSNYDAVFRIEFTLNSLGEPGVFLHFGKSI